MRRLATTVAAAATLALLVACGSAPPGARAASPGSPTPVPTAVADASILDPVVAAPRSRPEFPGLLRDLRAGHHRGYDRLVLEFAGATAPPHLIRYVDEVRADPSGQPVTLRGQAFAMVVVDGARTDGAALGLPGLYTGPTRITPVLPVLEEAAVTGDFEGVLSVAAGLDHVVGLRVFTLTGPARLVIDFLFAPSCRPSYPVTTTEQAWQAQRAFDEGHQPWLGSATMVTESYARGELGWQEFTVEPVGDQVLQVRETATGATAVVTVIQPARQGPGGIVAIADIAR